MATLAEFPISIGELFKRGVVGFRNNAARLLGAGLLAAVVVVPFRIASEIVGDGNPTLVSVLIDTAGAVAGATLALPWFRYGLAASRGEDLRTVKAFDRPKQFVVMAVCSFWFWAAVLLGFKFLYGLPSIFAIVSYAFYGYVIADNSDATGMWSLGQSVKMGDKKRIALMSIGVLFVAFNLVAGLPIGYAVNAFTIGGAALGLLVTSSITMVSGGALYDALKVDRPATIPSMRATRQRSKKRPSGVRPTSGRAAKHNKHKTGKKR